MCCLLEGKKGRGRDPKVGELHAMFFSYTPPALQCSVCESLYVNGRPLAPRLTRLMLIIEQAARRPLYITHTLPYTLPTHPFNTTENVSPPTKVCTVSQLLTEPYGCLEVGTSRLTWSHTFSPASPWVMMTSNSPNKSF